MNTAVELFAGVGGFGIALEQNGFNVVAQVEIDKKAQNVLRHRFPNSTLLPDVTEVTSDILRSTGFISDGGIITGGFPCFVAGTRILTERGWVPIEEVVVGDFVLTHTGNWQRVYSTMNKVADHRIEVRGFGIPQINTTEEHPFYVTTKSHKWNNSRRSTDVVMSAPEWVDAKDIQGKFAGQVLPLIDDNTEQDDEDFWWLIGRYLGDGWTTTGSMRGETRRSNRVVICCAHKEANELEEKINQVVHATRSEYRTVTKFTITQKWFVDFVAPYGRGANRKTLTKREFSLDEKKAAALLNGWISADGNRDKKNSQYKGTTVSRSLALSMSLLAQRAFGVVARLYEQKVPPTTVIEGRVVNQQTQYQVVIPDKNKHAVVQDNYGWKQVKNVKRVNEPTFVFNISVEGDESYIADGAIVHNCQDLSVGGRRAGLAGKRSGLFYEFARIIEETETEWVVLENVPGLLSSQGGRDMGAVIGTLAELGYGSAWRVLDAKEFGVPQRRRRVFIVARRFGDASSCAEVLFKRESVRGYSAESGGARQEFTAETRRSIEETDQELIYGKAGYGTYAPGVKALTASMEKRPEDSIVVQNESIVFYNHHSDEVRIQGDYVNTLPAQMGTGGNNMPLMAQIMSFPAGVNSEHANSFHINNNVRRLTPVECERLQGFPDNWTATGKNDAGAEVVQPDTARYKQLGNAIAVPVVDWIIKGIAELNV